MLNQAIITSAINAVGSDSVPTGIIRGLRAQAEILTKQLELRSSEIARFLASPNLYDRNGQAQRRIAAIDKIINDVHRSMVELYKALAIRGAPTVDYHLDLPPLPAELGGVSRPLPPTPTGQIQRQAQSYRTEVAHQVSEHISAPAAAPIAERSSVAPANPPLDKLSGIPTHIRQMMDAHGLTERSYADYLTRLYTAGASEGKLTMACRKCALQAAEKSSPR